MGSVKNRAWAIWRDVAEAQLYRARAILKRSRAADAPQLAKEIESLLREAVRIAQGKQRGK